MMMLCGFVLNCSGQEGKSTSEEETINSHAGESSVGESTAGESTAGESTAGESTAGESTAGESTAGESTAGESTAGESTAGEFSFGDSENGTGVFTGATPEQLILSNAPLTCTQISALAPYLPDEAGHYAGSIISPHRYPFVVEMVEYTLEETPDIPNCTSELAHKIDLVVLASQQEPPSDLNEAISYQTIETPTALMPTERRVILQRLLTPITLNEGESLLISISLAAEGSQHVCLALCEDERALPKQEYWSGASSMPFQWSSLDSFEITAESLIKVIGSTL